LAFYEADGKLWLLVSNADPYRNFSGGSLLAIDMDSVSLEVDRNFMHDLTAFALPLDPYVGGIGLATDRDPPLAIVASRYSEGASTRSAEDEAFVVDLSDMTRLALWRDEPRIDLKDDPYPVSTFAEQGRMFVGNLTDHSISVVRTRQTANADLFGVVDIRPGARVDSGPFLDQDDSGSRAVLSRLVASDPSVLPDDEWTLTYVDYVSRIVVPDGDVGARWIGGPLGFDVSDIPMERVDVSFNPLTDTMLDPFLAKSDFGTVLLWSDGSQILRAFSDGTDATYVIEMSLFSNAGSWDAVLGGPSPALVDGMPAIFYDGRTEGSDAGSIGLAVATDGVTYEPEARPVLSFDGAGTGPFTGMRHPFVRMDGDARGYRMWMSLSDGENWSIGLSESMNGRDWSDPTEVLRGVDSDLFGPVVSYLNGRYILYAAQPTETGFSIVSAWSYDGRRFSDLEVVIEEASGSVEDVLPRIALYAESAGIWRVESRDRGVFGAFLTTGGELVLADQGLTLRVASGHNVPDNLAGLKDRGGMHPGSELTVDGVRYLFVTTFDAASRERIAILAEGPEGWEVFDADVIMEGVGGNRRGAGAPVVHAHEGTFVMFYSATSADGTSAIRRATSSDGLTGWVPEAGDVLDRGPDWDALGHRPHSMERAEEGSLRLWFSGDNGSHARIGVAVQGNGNPLGPFRIEPSAFEDYQFGTGLPGSFDDTSVQAPSVVTLDGKRHMYYAGFDGDNWHIGHAEEEGGVWKRREDAASSRSLPVMQGLPRTFSALGVHAPVLSEADDGDFNVWFGGYDGDRWRVGQATGSLMNQASGSTDLAATLYPMDAFPTAEDTFSFATARGDQKVSVIELEQNVDAFNTLGHGMANMVLDEARGFLYVTTKLVNRIWVVDVRDDSTDLFQDANSLDLEAVIQSDGLTATYGFRDVVIAAQRGLAYVSATDPDSLVVFDLSLIEDNDTKELIVDAAVGSLPMADAARDRGEDTSTDIGAAGMALSSDETLLLATHFRDNSVVAFDLTLDAYGASVVRIGDVGENPHVVRFTPDGNHAVVGLYTGEVIDGTAFSTLAIIDTNPSSPRYLEVVTWISNR
jgi:DNA-binding beta-propeller fold protein YncE